MPMGSFDGSEVCELVGTYMLSQITMVIRSSDIGLYRDDGLGVMKRLGKPEIERKKKRIIQIFKDNGLKVIVQAHLRSAQFLDVEFDLMNIIFRPYRKPNSDPLYINKQSNHPPTVLKRVPLSFPRRFSDISSTEDVFQQSLPAYEMALHSSGFQDTLSYLVPNTQSNRRSRSRRRKVIWYNPPYSENVSTDIGHRFLNLIRKHFHPLHRLHKIFNTRTIKVSYCCMKNVGAIIS